jgi:hypothetical protein
VDAAPSGERDVVPIIADCDPIGGASAGRLTEG